MRSFQNFITKSCEEAIVIAVFGSYTSHDHDTNSDIDLLVLYDQEHTLKSIQQKILLFNSVSRQQIHLNAYQNDDFKTRLDYHDYKLLSILNDAIIFQCSDDQFRLPIYRAKVNAVTIEYNEKMGVKYLVKAIQNLKAACWYINHPTSEHPPQIQSIQTQTIRNSHLALGYLQASQTMKTTGNDTILTELLKDETSLLNTLLWIDNQTKKSNKLNLNIITAYVQRVHAEFARSGLARHLTALP